MEDNTVKVYKLEGDDILKHFTMYDIKPPKKNIDHKKIMKLASKSYGI